MTPEERHADAIKAAHEWRDEARQIMAERNRELIAERGGWPTGALAEVRAVEAERPGWSCAWFPANTTPGFERDPGFYAWRRGEDPQRNGWRRDEWYGATSDLLLAQLLGPPTIPSRPAPR